MLNVNKKRSYTKVIWYNYIKDMQNLEKYTIDFFYWVGNLGRPDNHIQHDKNEIKIEWIWFYGVSKRMDRLVVKLKAIKYKIDIACYLFFLSSSLAIELN